MSALSKIVENPTSLDALHGIHGRVCSPAVRSFVEYIISIHPTVGLPGRAAFEPTAIPRLLPSVILVQVERNAAQIRFRTRVVGQNLVDAAPARLSNRYLDEFVAEVRGAHEILETRRTVVETGLPFLRQGLPIAPFTYRMRAVEYIHCPLAADGHVIDHIVSYFCYVAD